jgi:Ni/Co efflux regulator RcnB
MSVTSFRKTLMLLGLAVMLGSGLALAEKPEWAGRGRDRHDGQERGDRRDDEGDRDGDRRRYEDSRPDRGYFDDRRRQAVREYYDEHYRGKRCPPGLAKKHNGCMPPGQAKKWRVGERLPREVVYHDVPPGIVVQIGLPPAGYRYVRVAADILLIAAATGVVIDAIEDLGRQVEPQESPPGGR